MSDDGNRMVDIYSSTWATINQNLEAIEKDVMQRIVASGTNLPETEFLRGKLAAVRQIRKLAEMYSKFPLRSGKQIPVPPPVDY